jgi:hypothetical protein
MDLLPDLESLEPGLIGDFELKRPLINGLARRHDASARIDCRNAATGGDCARERDSADAKCLHNKHRNREKQRAPHE